VSIQWKRGEFLSFRATTKVHLGKVEKDIFENDEIEFDGQTVKYAGEEFALSTLRAAVKAGWFVPIADAVSTYVPQPSDIRIRPAQAADMNSRGEPMKVEQASDEERVVGTVEAANVGGRATKEDPDGVVSTIKTAAKQRVTVTDASQVAAEINRLDNTPPPGADFTQSATGDVTQTIESAGELDTLLPEAEVHTPKKTTKTTKKASGKTDKVISVDTPHGTIDWDMSVHWKTRTKIILSKYASNPEVLNSILGIETKGVVNQVQGSLDN